MLDSSIHIKHRPACQLPVLLQQGPTLYCRQHILALQQSNEWDDTLAAHDSRECKQSFLSVLHECCSWHADAPTLHLQATETACLHLTAPCPTPVDASRPQ